MLLNDQIFSSDYMHLHSLEDAVINEKKIVCTKRHKSFKVSESVWFVAKKILENSYPSITIDKIISLTGYKSTHIERIVAVLIENNFAFTCSQEKRRLGYEIIKINSELTNKWSASLGYHLQTRNFPFVNYAAGSSGPREIMERMKDYSRQEIDSQRFKTYETVSKEIDLPPTFQLLDESNNQRNKAELQQTLNYSENMLFPMDLLESISFAFGKTDQANVPWTETPLVRRTSPSGGSRHPIEGYVINLENGEVWHIDSNLHRIRLIKNIQPIESDDYFGRFLKEKSDVNYIFLLTAVFQRNMYRYREPRTFRSVHMDAGHLSATLQAALQIKGFKTRFNSAPQYQKLSEFMELDHYEEGLMMSMDVSRS